MNQNPSTSFIETPGSTHHECWLLVQHYSSNLPPDTPPDELDSYDGSWHKAIRVPIVIAFLGKYDRPTDEQTNRQTDLQKDIRSQGSYTANNSSPEAREFFSCYNNRTKERMEMWKDVGQNILLDRTNLQKSHSIQKGHNCSDMVVKNKRF